MVIVPSEGKLQGECARKYMYMIICNYIYMMTSVPCRPFVCCRMSQWKGQVAPAEAIPRTKNSRSPGARQTGWIPNSA